MACDNKNTPFGEIMDIKITYTGCGGNCNGKQITYGMNLREVLDILVNNCDGSGGGDGSKWYSGEGVPTFPAKDGDYYLQADGKVWEYDAIEGWEETEINLSATATWGAISGDIALQQDLIEYIQNAIDNAVVNPSWGSIGGDILEQEDLIELIDEKRELKPTDVGKNMHLSEDKKINLGLNADALGIPNLTYISLDGREVADATGSFVALSDSLVGLFIDNKPIIEIDKASGNITVMGLGGSISFATGGASSLYLAPDSLEGSSYYNLVGVPSIANPVKQGYLDFGVEVGVDRDIQDANSNYELILGCFRSGGSIGARRRVVIRTKAKQENTSPIIREVIFEDGFVKYTRDLDGEEDGQTLVPKSYVDDRLSEGARTAVNAITNLPIGASIADVITKVNSIITALKS